MTVEKLIKKLSKFPKDLEVSGMYKNEIADLHIEYVERENFSKEDVKEIWIGIK